MTVSFEVQLLFPSTVTMLKKIKKNITIIPDIRLESSQYKKIIKLSENVNYLVDICNGHSIQKGKYTAYFTPEISRSI